MLLMRALNPGDLKLSPSEQQWLAEPPPSCASVRMTLLAWQADRSTGFIYAADHSHKRQT